MSIHDLGYVPVVEPSPGEAPVAYLPAVDHATAERWAHDIAATGEHVQVCALVPDDEFAAARQADAWLHLVYEEIREELPKDTRPPSHHHGAQTGAYPALDLAEQIAELRALGRPPQYTGQDMAVFGQVVTDVHQYGWNGDDAA
jgi:hypothetical protein